jgi:hypothetical protein
MYTTTVREDCGGSQSEGEKGTFEGSLLVQPVGAIISRCPILVAVHQDVGSSPYSTGLLPISLCRPPEILVRPAKYNLPMMTMKETQQEQGRRALWHNARSHVGIAVGNKLPWSPGHVVSSFFVAFIIMSCAMHIDEPS